MTFQEYALRMEAYYLSEIDRNHDLHYHAWLVSRVLVATDKKGKNYLYESFDQVYDRDKILKSIYGDPDKDIKLEKLLKIKQNQEEFRKKGGN